MANLTISEGIQALKTLKERHKELVELRNKNSEKETRFYGANADKNVVKEPVYDVKALDKTVTKLAAEIRKLDAKIKALNASVYLDYVWDDSILGQID